MTRVSHPDGMAGVLASLVEVPSSGCAVPRGRQLVLAINAGVLWTLSIACLALSLSQLGRAELFPCAFALLAVAHPVSVAAHGDSTGAPMVVRAIRIASWSILGGALVLPPLLFSIAHRG